MRASTALRASTAALWPRRRAVVDRQDCWWRRWCFRCTACFNCCLLPLFSVFRQAWRAIQHQKSNIQGNLSTACNSKSEHTPPSGTRSRGDHRDTRPPTAKPRVSLRMGGRRVKKSAHRIFSSVFPSNREPNQHVILANAAALLARALGVEGSLTPGAGGRRRGHLLAGATLSGYGGVVHLLAGEDERKKQVFPSPKSKKL